MRYGRYKETKSMKKDLKRTSRGHVKTATFRYKNNKKL